MILTMNREERRRRIGKRRKNANKLALNKAHDNFVELSYKDIDCGEKDRLDTTDRFDNGGGD